jgi:hypothetical protein
MTRSYSFDHFTAQKPHTAQRKPKAPSRSKEKKEHSTDDGAVHYGRAHAETEQMFKAHAMEQQLEEIAGVPQELTGNLLKATGKAVVQRARAVKDAAGELYGAARRLVALPFEVGQTLRRRYLHQH